MQALYETEVTSDQIDHLGHMNVRYYGVHARAGAERLLASVGLETGEAGEAGEGSTLVHRDSYVRHHQEQLVGAPLVVRGAFLSATPDRLRVYEELSNADTGALAATFVLSFALADRRDRSALEIPAAACEAARADLVELPPQGAPRSVSVDEDPGETAPSLDVLHGLDLAVRQARPIDPSTCDADGFVDALDVPELIWGGDPVPGREFRPLEDLADGGQMGFAIMESRSSYLRPARVGDRVQSFGAQLAVHAKAMVGRHWLVDVERGDAVAVFTVVNVAFDTSARRAIAIPDEVRRRMSTRLHPELGPRPD